MTKTILRVAFAAALALIATRSFAEDLIDIYNAAVQNDPIFHSEEFTLRAEQQGPASARADLLPTVALFATHGRKRDKRSANVQFVTEGGATFDSSEYGVSVTQTIFDRDKFLTYEQSKLEAQVAEAEFGQAQHDLITRVVNRYFGILAAQDNLDLALAERRAIFRQLELARSRLEVGLGTSTDLHDAKARFELAQAEEIRAQQTLEDAHQALWELIGRRAERLDELREDSPLTPPDPQDQSVWVERSAMNNLALISAGLNEEIQRRTLSRQKARRMPTLNLELSHNVANQQGSISGGELTQYSTEARLQLEIPIFQGGGISADSRAASFRFQAAEQQTESALRAATRNARSGYLDVITSVREAFALDQAVVASKKALESRRESFEAGLNTNLDVLDAQKDLFQAKRDYLEARYRYITNKLELYSVAGELDVDDLETVNTWLK
ncbi:MAG: Outer membrane protein TolC [Gammaproteobacteria bacterium]|nr:Outer membrane protein TolC [Gammaproteobacteria bacterium]